MLALVVTAYAAGLALESAANNTMLRIWCASPSGWGRDKVRVGAAKHYGSEARKSVGAAAAPNLDSGFFTPMRCAWHTWLSFLAGRVGAPARVRRCLLPVFRPYTACHPSSEAMSGRVTTCSVGATMANTPQGRTAPALFPTPADTVALHFEAVNACAMARWYAARHNYAAAARKLRQGLVALRRLQSLEGGAA